MPANTGDTTNTHPEGESDAPVPDRRALTSPANGRLSRGGGPRTPAGRAVSRFNATRHGILSRHLLLKDAAFPAESRKQLGRLHAQLRAELSPEGIVEEMLVERILVAYWRLRRVLIAEQGLIARGTINHLENQALGRGLLSKIPGGESEEQQLLDDLRRRHSAAAALLLKADDIQRVTRYEAALDRQLNGAIRDLLDLQRRRLQPSPDAPTPALAPTPTLPPIAINIARVEVQPPASPPLEEP